MLRPGDRVCIEGHNQKHADFLAQALSEINPENVHELHIVQSDIALPAPLPAPLDVFESGIARKLDFCHSGPQRLRMAELVKAGRIELGAIHTYLELYGRYFMDLAPRVSLIAADMADAQGNLYTGSNRENTPAHRPRPPPSRTASSSRR